MLIQNELAINTANCVGLYKVISQLALGTTEEQDCSALYAWTHLSQPMLK